MNTIKIRVRTDRKAALLAGVVLGETVDIDVDPETVPPEIWPTIVGALDMGQNPPTLFRVCGYLPAVAAATESALVASIRAIMVVDAAAKSEKSRKEQPQIAKNDTLLAAWESDPIKRNPTKTLCGSNENGAPLLHEWEEWSVKYCGEWGMLPANWVSRKAAVLARIEPEIVAHNAPNIARIQELKIEDERCAIIRAEKTVAETKVANIAKYAARLASGFWERETGSYNERRYSSPWCAAVSFPSGPKAVYSWGDSTGKWGKEGLLRIACKPGEIIAWGQKDLRRPDKSEHTILHMQPDGRMVEITSTEAFRLWTAAQLVNA